MTFVDATDYLLLVDDEPYNLMLLSDLLALEGYTTRTASCGAEAIDLIQAEPPQLILLDVMMPDMSGFEVCEWIRTQPDLQTTPVIFLTALDDDASRLQGINALGDDYLTKPIQADLVLTKVASRLRLTKLRQDSFQAQLQRQSALFHQRRQEFHHYVATHAHMASHPNSAALQRLAALASPPTPVPEVMDRAEVTILFCDIRNFTAIAEHQDPQDTLHWLNAFYADVNRVIEQEHGVIDKYIGDAVMAVFRRPHQHGADGLQAALQIQLALQQFNQNYQRFALPHPIAAGVGVHSGEGVMGVLGDQQRLGMTVIGDVVNTAARLETLTKTYQRPVLFSDSVLAQLPPDHDFAYRQVDTMAPKGKQTPLTLYSLHIPPSAESEPPQPNHPTAADTPSEIQAETSVIDRVSWAGFRPTTGQA